MRTETGETMEKVSVNRPCNKATGVFFIIMGGIFILAMSQTRILGHSPWILMALLPAYWIGIAAYGLYKEGGEITGRVFATLVFGLMPFAYIAASLLDFDAGGLWPIGLIAVGVTVLLFGGNR